MTNPSPINWQVLKQSIDRGRRNRWWRRKRAGKTGFFYVDANGMRISDDTALSRIKSLVIPPAWKYVRISPSASGRLQAIGVDTTGRIQYLYHQKFTDQMQRKKFAKVEKFGEHLAPLRRATNDHISLDGFPREKVLAVMIRLINSLYMRVGTDKSVRRYKTFGITTLQNRHLQIGRNGRLTFEFVGKSHVKHRKVLVDDELCAILSELQRSRSNQKLFRYRDDEGKSRPIRPNDINQYLKSLTSTEFSSKDFRTWGATLLAATALADRGKVDEPEQVKKNINRAIRSVAENLGNTPAVCRASYIHPIVFKAYADGVVLERFTPRRARKGKRLEPEMEPEEYSLLQLLRDYRN